MPPLALGCLGSIVMFIVALVCANKGFETGMWLGLIGIGASIFITAYFQRKRESSYATKQFDEINTILSKTTDFKASHKFISPIADGMIAIDEVSKKVLLIENKHNNLMHFSKTSSKYEYQHKVFSFNDVLQAEILEDGVTVNKTSTGSQVGRAVLGGLVAGGVGAVIGGLSGETVSSDKIKKAQLKVIVNDKEKSFYIITLVSFDEPQSKDNLYYKPMNDKLIHCFNLLTHILKNEEKNITTTSSVADELTKLAALYKDNLLTLEEYEHQKHKLLS